MIESGRVIAIEENCIWVETTQKSTCGSCAAQKACGQNLLASLYPSRTDQLRVSTEAFAGNIPGLGDQVEFSVPDHALLGASLTVYILPLAGLMAGAFSAAALFDQELLSIAGAALGLVGGVTAARQLDRHRNPSRVLPQLLRQST